MTEPNPINILIAEDQAITRFGLKCALQSFPELQIVAESADGADSVRQAQAIRPHVILMDIGLPTMDGIEATKQIKATVPGCKIIMFTSSDDDASIFSAMNAGADGYCLKNVEGDHLAAAIHAVMRGAAWLDPGLADKVLRAKMAGGVPDPRASISQQNPAFAQVNILQMLSSGLSVDQIAAQLGVPTQAIHDRIRDIMQGFEQAAVPVGVGAAPHMVQATPTGAIGLTGTGMGTIATGDEAILPAGTTVGERYVIESVVGHGGMGMVYKAKHMFIDRTVAIKMLHRELAADANFVKRLQVEATTAGSLSHPNLVTVYDFGITASRQPFLVMDFLSGRSLDEALEEYGSVDVYTGIGIFAEVCDALAAAHQRGIIHRDLKPSNIFLAGAEDGTESVRLVDFGIAKKMEDNEMMDKLTRTGQVVGTPSYMSPEHCMGKELDVRSDIYSLGCVMYKTFTGVLAFDGRSVYELMRQHVQDEPPEMPFLRPELQVPMELMQLILRCMAKNPEQRPQSAMELKRQLLAIPLPIA